MEGLSGHCKSGSYKLTADGESKDGFRIQCDMGKKGSGAPLIFLVVTDIVFNGSRDTFGLYAIDVCGCNGAIQVGILGKGLETAATEGGSLSIDGWCE
jgi:hypothetical protein